MWRRISGWLRKDEGQGLVEYVFLISVVALGAIVALNILGGRLPTFSNSVVPAF